ncbi:MAG TPA: HAD family phosphatase [Candidatus Cloacimonadota bacterium]|nr:HAD family phosphatase [Candidatus Cloacimonadota bacterium]
MIEAVIFDLDGTLIDSMGVWDKVDIEFLNKRNITVPDNLFADISGGNGFNDLAILFRKRFQLTESLEQIKEEWQSMVEGYYRHDLKIRDNVFDVLTLLKEKGLKLAIGTSNSEHLARLALESNNISTFFSFMSCGCHNVIGKPQPDIYLRAAKNIGIEPEKCLVIEDSLVGVQAGKNANMKVFSIADDYSIKDLDAIINASDKHFDNYDEMYHFFKENLKKVSL